MSRVLDRLAARSEWQATERSAEIGDCLVWTGSTNQKGYGHIKIKGRLTSIHRAAWIERHGEPPAETPYVLHHCDNPPCWRDEHLFIGTNDTNMADMVNKKRQGSRQHGNETHCPQNHPYDEENTHVDSKGRRNCRACDRQRHRKKYVPRLRKLNKRST